MDLLMFPHILEAIIKHTLTAAHMSLRATCRQLRDKIDAMDLQHVSLEDYCSALPKRCQCDETSGHELALVRPRYRVPALYSWRMSYSRSSTKLDSASVVYDEPVIRNMLKHTRVLNLYGHTQPDLLETLGQLCPNLETAQFCDPLSAEIPLYLVPARTVVVSNKVPSKVDSTHHEPAVSYLSDKTERLVLVESPQGRPVRLIHPLGVGQMPWSRTLREVVIHIQCPGISNKPVLGSESDDGLATSCCARNHDARQDDSMDDHIWTAPEHRLMNHLGLLLYTSLHDTPLDFGITVVGAEHFNNHNPVQHGEGWAQKLFSWIYYDLLCLEVYRHLTGVALDEDDPRMFGALEAVAATHEAGLVAIAERRVRFCTNVEYRAIGAEDQWRGRNARRREGS